MGLYIYRIVIDAGVINVKGGLSAMNELELFFKLGIIEILKTSVMDTDLQGDSRKQKAKSYGTIYGPNWIGHTEEFISGGIRPSNMEIIYRTLWGKVWMKGSESQKKFIRNSFRDSIHLDICWMNGVDFFITSEKALLKKRNALYDKGFDVKIVTPEECVTALRMNFKQDIGTDDITTISNRIQKMNPILLGSNDCKNTSILDPKTGEVLFRTHWIKNQLHLEANIYDSYGNKITKLIPKTSPVIFSDSAFVQLSDPCPKVFYLLDHVSPNPKVEQYLKISDDPVSNFTVGKGGEVLLSGRILPSGHTIFEGKFFNNQGELIAEIEKKLFRYLGIHMINSSRQTLPITLNG